MGKKTYNSHEIVKNWYEFSINPRTEEEIRTQILTNPSSVCYSYICMKSKLSEQFIEELIILSTNLFNEQTYTPTNIKAVMNILDIENLEKRTHYVKELCSHKLIPDSMIKKMRSDAVIRDRLDWRNILKYQNVSKSFVRKHRKEIEELKRSYRNVDTVAI